MKCIICHIEIVESVDFFEQCPNGHKVHEECLKEWLIQNQSCPLCNTQYSQSLLNKYQSYLDQKVKEKEEAISEQMKQETMQKFEKIAEKIVFLKFVEYVEELIEREEYNKALERLEAVYDKDAIALDFNTQTILFLQGKINYLRKRFDLAINFLFKLVKQRFDYPDAFLYLGKSYQELGDRKSVV